MRNPRLATRYAKSLVDLAVEQGQLEQVYADMQWLQAVCKSSRDFVNLLRSPIIKADKKNKIIDAVIAQNVSPLSKAFITLLINKGREKNLEEVAGAVIAQYKVKKGIQTVTLTTATPVSEATKQAIVNKIQSSSDYKQVDLESVVDDSIIGGFVLKAGDKLIDASIAYDLKAIARQFENNDFIYKVR